MNMGNFVSNNCYYLHLRRCVYRYNVENRAHKELKRQESSPVVAPKHEAGIIDYQKSMRGKAHDFHRISIDSYHH